MGYWSEQMIAEHNALMEDDEYAEEYFRELAMEEAGRAARDLELEREEEWFADQLIDYRGEPIELPPAQVFVPADFDDIPF